MTSDVTGTYYSYRLDERGIQLFNRDGSPQLATAAVAAEIDSRWADRRGQTISRIQGLGEVTLFYGYHEGVQDGGLTPSNSVVISAGMDGAAIAAAIEQDIVGFDPGDVTVTGSGLAEDPWQITLSSAPTDPSGRYLQFGYAFTSQAYLGNLALRDDARIAQYFYRYDLDEGGEYLFQQDGSPRLTPIVNPAELDQVAAANGVQRFWLADGIERVNLFYGYSETELAHGRTPDNSVAIHSGMTAENLEAALESLPDVVRVMVLGAGTAADPWEVIIQEATSDSNGDYLQFASHYDVQEFVGRLTPREDTRVFERHYRLTDPAAEFLFENDGSPDVVTQSDTVAAVANNSVQLLARSGLDSAGLLWYGDSAITVTADTTSEELETRLKSLSEISNVRITGAGTQADPWQFRFLATKTATLSGSVSVGDVWELQVERDGLAEFSISYEVTDADTQIADVVRGLAEAARNVAAPAAAAYLFTAEDDSLVIERTDGGLFDLHNVPVVPAGGSIAETEKLNVLDPGTNAYRVLQLVGGATAQAADQVTTRTVRQATEAAALANDRQVVQFPVNALQATFYYDNDSVEVQLDGKSETLRTALQSLDGINEVAVLPGATPADPWTIVLLDAAVNGNGYLPLQYATTVQVGPNQLASSNSSENLTQSIGIPAGSDALVWYGTDAVSVSNTMDVADVALELAKLSGLRDSNVAVTGVGSVANPWLISLSPKDGGAASYDRFVFNLKQPVAAPVMQEGEVLTPPRRMQELPFSAESLALWYGDQSVDTTFSSAAEVESALKSLVAVNDVRVIAIAGGWRIQFIDAALDADGGFATLRTEIYQWDDPNDQLGPLNLHEPGTSAKRLSLVASVADHALRLEDWQDHARFEYGEDSVELTSEMELAQVTSALESMASVVDVWVAGQGTVEEPWHVVWRDANRDPNGAPLTPARVVQAQRMARSLDVVQNENPRTQWIPATSVKANTEFFYGGASVTLNAGDIDGADPAHQAQLLQAKLRLINDLNTVVVTFESGPSKYRLAFPAVPQEITFTPSGGLQTASTRLGDELQSQWIPALAIAENTQIQYDGQQLTLQLVDLDLNDTDQQAVLLQNKLRTSPSLAGVVVEYDAETLSYQISFPTVPDTLLYNDGQAASEAEVAIEVRGSLTLPVGLTSVALQFDNSSVLVDLTQDTVAPLGVLDAADLLDALSGFTYLPGSVVLVDGNGTLNEPWTITIEGYDELQPVVVSYVEGYFAALALGQGSSFQTIERQDEAGSWSIETSGGDFAVFSLDGDTGGEVYLRPYQTVERESPRLVEKPVWADLNGDGQVEMTGETDWFEDPTWVNDHRSDSVVIGGSALADYFLIGHEVLNADTPLEEKQTDTVQVSQYRADANGQPLTSDSVIFTIRGIDLQGEATGNASYDRLTINGNAGNDQLIAGFLPNSTEITDEQIITARAVDFLRLEGGEGHDRLVGTPYADVLDGGAGDDVVTGSAGVDTFVDTGGTDTLIESRDLNFSLSTVISLDAQQQPVSNDYLDVTGNATLDKRRGAD